MQRHQNMICEICGKENENKHQDYCVDLGCSGRMIPPREKTATVAEVPCSAGLDGPLDTGDLVNDPLYKALDKLYERGWIDKHQEVDYDPRGTTQWQDVLDLFRLQKAD